MACLSTTFKYLVLLFNLLFFFLGCAIVGCGIYMKIMMATYFDLLGNLPVDSATICIIIGVIVTIVAFFGCCGACMENPCMLYTFGSLVAFILLIEVGATVAVLIYKDETKNQISMAMRKGLKQYNVTGYGGITLAWDEMQQAYKCCGVNGTDAYKQWKGTSFEQSHLNSVPDSCCKAESRNCGQNQLDNPDRIYTMGCFSKFANDVETRVEITGAVGGILGFIQVMAILVSFCLGRRMRYLRYEDPPEYSPSAPLYYN